MKKNSIIFLAEGFLEEKVLMFFKISENEIKNTNSVKRFGSFMQDIYKKDFQYCIVGIMDNDKDFEDTKYFKEFSEEFEGNITLENAILKKHLERPHYLVIVTPAMEKWLLHLADISEIELTKEKFGFKDFESLKAITKHETVLKNTEIDNFLSALLENSTDFQHLKNWLKNLRQQVKGFDFY